MAQGKKGGRKAAKTGPTAETSAVDPQAADNHKALSDHRRVEAAAFLRSGFSTLLEDSASPEHALTEMAIHGAISVLAERSRKFGVAMLCCRCSADPDEPECMLYAPNASGQLRPIRKIPKSESDKYIQCG